jgi:CRISPR-associated protein Csm1
MLSRMLNLFFKGHIDTLIETDTEYTPKLSNKHGKDRDVVVIYAGGDDLMIAGSWNDVFELSFHIRESFRRYTADNPGITISAGYGIFDEKTPVKRMADLVSDRLEISKEEGRNRIFMLERGIQATNGTVFSKSYEWDKFLEIWNRISDIYSLNGEPKLKISKSLIWKILEAREVYLRDQKSVYWFITPMYHLSRADKDKKIKAGRIFSFLFKINPEDEVQEIYHVDVPLKIMDLATRRGGG